MLKQISLLCPMCCVYNGFSLEQSAVVIAIAKLASQSDAVIARARLANGAGVGNLGDKAVRICVWLHIPCFYPAQGRGWAYHPRTWGKRLPLNVSFMTYDRS